MSFTPLRTEQQIQQLHTFSQRVPALRKGNITAAQGTCQQGYRARHLQSTGGRKNPANPALALALCASLWCLELPSDLIVAEPAFGEPFVNHLTLAQTCWEHKVICKTKTFQGFLLFLPSWACCFSQDKIYKHGRDEEKDGEKLQGVLLTAFHPKMRTLQSIVSCSYVIISSIPHCLQSEIRTCSTMQVSLLGDTIAPEIKITCILLGYPKISMPIEPLQRHLEGDQYCKELNLSLN